MDERIPDRRLALLLPSAFVTSMGIGIVNLGLLFVVKEAYGASPAQVGWFGALFSLAYAVGCLAFRPLARVLSAPTSMALMNFGVAAVLLAHLGTPGLVSAFLANIVYGLLTALFWPRLMGWLTSGLEGNALGRANGAFSVSWSAGSIVSPFVSGLLSERGVFVPVYVGIALYAATGAFIVAARRVAPAPAVGAGASAAALPDRSTPLRYPSWVGAFLIYAFMGVFVNIFPVYAKDELALSESAIGLILLVRASATALGFWIFGRLVFWHFKAALIPLVLGAALAIDLVFVFVRAPAGVAAWLFAGGLAQAGIYTAALFYGVSGARDRDRRVTIHETLLTMGQVVGSIAGGIVYQSLSWGSVFVGIGVVMALGIAVQLVLVRRIVS